MIEKVIKKLRALADSRMGSEKAARDADEEWLKTFNAISDFVFIENKEHIITRANRAFAELLKLPQDKIAGMRCYELVHNSKKPWPGCPMEISRETGKPYSAVIEDPGIGVPLLVTVSPILDEKGELQGTVHIAKDISQQVESQKKLREAVEIKSQFVSMVSHELRTPLTAIKEGIGIVEEGIAGKLNEKQREYLGIAKRNVDRLARLIGEVLDFQKIEAGKTAFRMRRNDLNEAVREVYRTMSPAAMERGLKFTLHLGKDIPDIIFDRDGIIQVVMNIVDNAIKYTEKGSISISTIREDKNVAVKVSDTGPGIYKEDFPRLFQSFEQIQRGKYKKAGGTGLGLAISKQIIESHGGKIWAESTPGKGTTFQFVLPIGEHRG